MCAKACWESRCVLAGTFRLLAKKLKGRVGWRYDVLPAEAVGGGELPAAAVPSDEEQARARAHAFEGSYEPPVCTPGAEVSARVCR